MLTGCCLRTRPSLCRGAEYEKLIEGRETVPDFLARRAQDVLAPNRDDVTLRPGGAVVTPSDRSLGTSTVGVACGVVGGASGDAPRAVGPDVHNPLHRDVRGLVAAAGRRRDVILLKDWDGSGLRLGSTTVKNIQNRINIGCYHIGI